MTREELINLSGQVVNGMLSADDSNLDKLVDRTFHPVLAKIAVSTAHKMLEEIDRIFEKKDG